MRKIALVKYRLNIHGLYGWGKGWLNPDYPARWSEMCHRLNTDKDSLYEFKNASLKLGGSGTCEEFTSDNFSAYMHGMEIVGWLRSSEYCPGSNERIVGEWEKKLHTLAEFIRDEFSDVKLTMDYNITRYDVDLDNPTVTKIIGAV